MPLISFVLFCISPDVPFIARELFEVLCTPRGQKPEDINTNQLIDLLVQKDKELQNALKTGKVLFVAYYTCVYISGSICVKLQLNVVKKSYFFQFLAQEQAELQKKYDALKAEVDKRDADIKQLQRSLKEAETILVCVLTGWMPGIAFLSAHFLIRGTFKLI